MSIVDDLKSLDTNAVVIISVFFVSFIAPAFLLIYKFNKPIFIQLDTIKLIILSISIASPSFLFLFIVTWVSDAVLVHFKYYPAGHLGTMADWFVLQGMSNTSILYIVSFLTYAFDLTVKSVVWWMVGLIVLYTIHEFWRVLVVAKRPEFKASALRMSPNANKAFKSDS
ncbi:hypothetical protein [Vibrio parahaemolyticus]|uniref:hypothetical protein n=1 Tax=Vibrio parahaemolyticus TaxID=670 RepID=UPI00084B1F87|nr:hypothetical protein [Vibrio parahaemolyticus]EJG1717161.1 hypothetical protein [Vibrio parahaemolyticus]ODZ44646.1 hypothetical protein BBM41_19155 [Vibrio parahaemolyticus]ODZ62966.1 hypothetical protein BBM42_11825 [Vibrio parahaemolyticus]OQK38930.1 hypothetical protein XM71_c11790 [Vibrio parahaemolyticus]HCG7179559.1 hypothetical protein [Vibrio parahaemolyticus]